jgi:hypothetical protein
MRLPFLHAVTAFSVQNSFRSGMTPLFGIDNRACITSDAIDPKRTSHSAFELEEARNWETGHQLSWVEPFP